MENTEKKSRPNFKIWHSRKSRANRRRKNTLYVIFQDDICFFGISRCNLAVDTFDNKEGIEHAKTRAERAMADYFLEHKGIMYVDEGFGEDIYLNDFYNRGWCSRAKLLDLKNSFFNLETIMHKKFCVGLGNPSSDFLTFPMKTELSFRESV